MQTLQRRFWSFKRSSKDYRHDYTTWESKVGKEADFKHVVYLPRHLGQLAMSKPSLVSASEQNLTIKIFTPTRIGCNKSSSSRYVPKINCKNPYLGGKTMKHRNNKAVASLIAGVST